MHGVTWAPVGFLVVFVALLVYIMLHKQRRRRGWTKVATEFGLNYDRGDPLGLSRRLGADVSETIWGRFEGADVAVVTATRLLSPLENPERWLTSSMGVSLRIGITRGLQAANDAAGETMLAGVTPDGMLIVTPRGKWLRRAQHPTSARDLPELLRATARASRSQYW
jgi:hypothetical protein